MDVITIPKKIIKNDDLVLLPRKLYEYFLSIVDRHNQLEKDLSISFRQAKAGRIKGPFASVGELKKALG
ncbi:hypothetical protein FJ208_01210 [Candidatus Gribaldobacteria bacterium]|nr:hypothetical protein [Candidatus Gribaldobacteria bacterium]